MRDIVAAQKLGGCSRKRAFASAPELVAAKRQRVDVGSQQNATFDTITPAFNQQSAFLGSNPLLAMLSANASQGRASLPPKAISCMSLGLNHRNSSSLNPSSTTTVHQDPLLRQLQILRAQNQANNSFSKGNMHFPQQQPAIISQTNMRPSQHANINILGRGIGTHNSTSNATWDIPATAQQPQEPLSCVSSSSANNTNEDDDSALRRWIDRLAQEEP